MAKLDNGPLFHIHRHKMGFNAVPTGRKGWMVVIGYIIAVTLISLIPVYPVIVDMSSFWYYFVASILIVIVLTGLLIKFVLDHGEDI
ncbi:MAG: hypothetical protein AAFP97_04355 [Pseudomonadota bacterium]